MRTPVDNKMYLETILRPSYQVSLVIDRARRLSSSSSVQLVSTLIESASLIFHRVTHFQLSDQSQENDQIIVSICFIV